MKKVFSIGLGILISLFIFSFLFQFISSAIPGLQSGGGTHPFINIAFFGVFGFIFIPIAIILGVIFGLFISKHMPQVMVGWPYWKIGLIIGLSLSIVFITLQYSLLDNRTLDTSLIIIELIMITLPCILFAFIFGKIKGAYEKIKTRSKEDLIEHN